MLARLVHNFRDSCQQQIVSENKFVKASDVAKGGSIKRNRYQLYSEANVKNRWYVPPWRSKQQRAPTPGCDEKYFQLTPFSVSESLIYKKCPPGLCRASTNSRTISRVCSSSTGLSRSLSGVKRWIEKGDKNKTITHKMPMLTNDHTFRNSECQLTHPIANGKVTLCFDRLNIDSCSLYRSTVLG